MPSVKSFDMQTVQLHGKKAAGRTALVDDADYELVSKYRWRVYQKSQNSPGSRDSGPYAVANTRRSDGHMTTIKMHCLVLGAPGVDHLNHNGLDNQRHNLRLATKTQNLANQRARARSSSRFKGVSWHRMTKKWRARIGIYGTQRYLGLFSSEEEAARVYDAAARDLFGDYAYVNFPGGESVAV